MRLGKEERGKGKGWEKVGRKVRERVWHNKRGNVDGREMEKQ